MEDIIIIAVLAIIVGLAVFYIIKAKKSGKKCIGCPHAAVCISNKQGCTGTCSTCSCDCSGKNSD